ncbi:hypothetical protein AC578_2001 [Pseudocercospora eumusae]|uniref:Uncharacterized protein n=1 Tax=Pseudocercospora eumusae TaxID=321146 RepID=A0A139HH53_9PEZI|nr:hypothetical protein AC578_2001 [Pseudocercospora eumusae]
MATPISDPIVEQLRATLRQLQAINAGLDQAIALQEGTTKAPASCRFFYLPIELRDRVYDICLAVGKVFLPPFLAGDVRLEGRREYKRPQWQLLAVSKQVRWEAAKRLFACNLMVLSAGFGSKDGTARNPWMTRVFLPSDPTTMWRSSFEGLKRKFLTKVSVSFDIRCGDGLQKAIITRMVSRHGRTAADEGDCRSISAPLIWRDMLKYSFSPVLRHLQIDLTNCYSNCYCALGCHRQAYLAAGTIYGNQLMPISLETLEILGTQTAKERRQLTATVKFKRQANPLSSTRILDQCQEKHAETVENGKFAIRFKAFKTPTDFSSFRFYAHEDLGDETIEFGPPVFHSGDIDGSWYERAPMHKERTANTGS